MLTQLSIDRLRQLARIEVADDGGPIRTIVGTRRMIWTGEYYSSKTRRSHPWESPLERDHFHRIEVDTDVVDYLAQPHRLMMTFDGRVYDYTPDVRVRFADGGTEIREIKKSKKEIERDPFYEIKLFLAGYLYEELGWSYRILDKADVREPAITFANSREFQQDGPLTIRPDEIATVHELFSRAKRPELPLALIAEALGGWVRGLSLARAMMVHRIIRIPLDRIITRETPARLVPPVVDYSRRYLVDPERDL
jgi:hypothetical protein